MVKQERQSQILAIIEEKQYVTVQDLHRQLYVSLPTVRRDLAEMTRLGLIQRQHGGACMIPKGHTNRPTIDRISKMDSHSQAVSQVLAELLTDDSVVFTDTSPYEQAICDALLCHQNLIIVTNSPSLPPRLRDLNGSVHCLGGLYHRGGHAVAGEIAETALEQYNFDYAIISGAALNSRGDITCGSLCIASELRRAMRLARCRIVISVGDSSDDRNICNIMPVSAVDYLVSDQFMQAENLSAKLILL